MADIYQKVMQQLFAINTMRYFRAKLYTIGLRAFYMVSGNFNGIRAGDDLKIAGYTCNSIRMRHPNLRICRYQLKQRALGVDILQVCPPILAGAGWQYLATIKMR